MTTNNVPLGAHVMEASRFGSFLRHIPATRRVGDYAHAAARVLNAIFKRIDADAKNWPSRSTAKEIRQVPLSFGPSWLLAFDGSQGQCCDSTNKEEDGVA